MVNFMKFVEAVIHVPTHATVEHGAVCSRHKLLDTKLNKKDHFLYWVCVATEYVHVWNILLVIRNQTSCYLVLWSYIKCVQDYFCEDVTGSDDTDSGNPSHYIVKVEV